MIRLRPSVSRNSPSPPRRLLRAEWVVPGGIALGVLLALGTSSTAAQEPGDVIRLDRRDLPAEAACAMERHPAPSLFVHEDGSYGRLSDDLRAMARRGDPVRSLARAALYRYKSRSPVRDDILGHPWRSFGDRARAFADIAVTGRRSYEALVALDLSREALAPRVRRALSADVTLYRLGSLDPARMDDAVTAVIDRAYEVAWALRGPVAVRQSLRPGLGWIAVSGEDDRPHRPVNVDSASFPQREVGLSIDGRPLTVRAVFMNPDIDDWPDETPTDRERLPAVPPIPPLPGDIVLFLHGHASRAEEASTLAPRLFAEAASRNRSITLVSLDLPGYGYGSPLDTGARFSRLPMDSVPNTYPGLDFLDASVDALGGALEQAQPGARNRLMGVIGGSLGGNLSLRLAGRDPSSFTFPWMRNVVAWSPASVWPSFADDCSARSSIERCARGLIFSDEGKRQIALHATFDMIGDRFHEGKRGDFYSGAITQKGSQFSNAGKWYRDGFRCKENYIEGGKWATGEYFSEDYLPWHWRIAHEQLVFSHWDAPRRLLDPYETYPKLLLIAPEADDTDPEYLYRNAVRLGAARRRNFGWTLDVANTGHSIHAERPVFLARRIVDFFYDPPPETVMTVID